LLHGVVLTALRSIEPQKLRLSSLNHEGHTIPGPEYQERTFAYEFYHQLRKLEETGSDNGLQGFTQQAEVDKGYQGIDYVPDLIIHKPGQTNNLAAFEFKLATDRYIPYDLAKLQFFVDKVRYKEAFMILIGEDSSKQRISDLCARYDCEDGTPIHVTLFNYGTSEKRILLDSIVKVKLPKPYRRIRPRYRF